ncbi:MAG: PilZ domain-containing protein, partial [candidate division NC10 bacterium]
MDHAATRQHPRLPLRMPVFCESPAVSGYRTVGLTQNVSRDGLLLEVPQPLAAGTSINLLLLTGDRNARAEAVVVWKAEDPPSRMGLKFTALTGGDLATWERLLVLQAGPTPRASVRLPIALEVACRIPPDMRVTGQAENISEGGLQLAVGQGLSPRTLLTVEIPPWFTLPTVEAEMEVVWNRGA